MEKSMNLSINIIFKVKTLPFILEIQVWVYGPTDAQWIHQIWQELHGLYK